MAGINIEGLPEKYDATQMLQALEAIVGQLESAQAAPVVTAEPARPIVPTGVALSRRNRAGLYATETDPRISDPQIVSLGDVTQEGEYFDIKCGAQMGPWACCPLVKDGAPIDELHVVMACLVLKIPHRLGRLPGRIEHIHIPEEGYNPVLRIGGGNDPGSRTEYDLDEELRLEIAFDPIWGVDPEDVERRLRFWVGSTPRPPGFNSYADVSGSSDLDLPDLPTQFFSDAVTTDKHFSGILHICVYGFPSFQYAIKGEYATDHVQNPVTGANDSQIQMPNHSGHNVAVLSVEKWLGAATSLQDISDDGLFVYLDQCGLQFLLR